MALEFQGHGKNIFRTKLILSMAYLRKAACKSKVVAEKRLNRLAPSSKPGLPQNTQSKRPHSPNSDGALSTPSTSFNLPMVSSAPRSKRRKRISPPSNSPASPSVSFTYPGSNQKAATLPPNTPQPQKKTSDQDSVWLTKRFEMLESGLNKFDQKLSLMKPLHMLLDLSSSSDIANLLQAAYLVETSSVEITQRIECRKQIIIYNFPKRFSLNTAKVILQSNCHLADMHFTLKRP